MTAEDGRERLGSLLRLDREIRRTSGAGRRGAQVITALVAVLLLGMLSVYPALVPAGPARGTVAGLTALLVVGGYVLAPVITGRGGFGLRVDHVRLLPVDDALLARALALATLRTPGAAGVLAGLVAAALWVGGGPLARVAAVLVALLVTVVALVGARVTELLLATSMRSPVGRVVAAVVAVVLAGSGYLALALLGQALEAIASDGVLRAALRVLPTGWPVVAGEAAAVGRWWVVVLLVAALLVLVPVLARWWRRLLRGLLEGGLQMQQSRRRATRSSTGAAARGPLVSAVLTEVALLGRDPRRIGLVVLPLMFVLLGLGIMVGGLDVYGMAVGAPLVLLVASSPFTNGFGLDGPSFWRVVVMPGSGERTIDARMIVAGCTAALVATIGTVAGRVVGSAGPETLPVAVAVVLAGGAGVAATACVQSATAPFKVEASSVMSAMTARGSMTGTAIGWSLLTIAAIAATMAPGALVALLLPGPLAWAGVPVAAAAGAAAIVIGRRRSRSLLSSRGPEIYAKVR